MRDYFGLREHIRAALIASGIFVGAAGMGCGRTDGLGEGFVPLPPNRRAPPTVDPGWCIAAADATRAASPGTTFTEMCPDLVGPVLGNEDWLPEGVLPDTFGRIDDEATEKQRDARPPLCCYEWEISIVVEGRPLIDGGALHTATPRARSWRQNSGGGEVDVRSVARSMRTFLARAWLRDALAEHASIASFARTTMELMALGAPRELVRDAQAAGLDEVRHADLCFELAAAYAVEPLGPGPLAVFAPRAPDLARLARDTFLEGCVSETIAALRATRASAGCEVPAVKSMLNMIARDETKHAALAWRTIAWARIEGGDAVSTALKEAAIEAQSKRLEPRTRTTAPALRATLTSFGRLDHEAKSRAETDAWREIIRPTLTQIVTIR